MLMPECPDFACAEAKELATAVRPLRILHVVTKMDRGGIEVSLMQLLRTIDRQRYRMDFLVLDGRPGAQDDDIRALGSRIIICDVHRKHWRIARQFDRIMSEYGPYDVLHSHVHFSGGYLLSSQPNTGFRYASRIAATTPGQRS